MREQPKKSQASPSPARHLAVVAALTGMATLSLFSGYSLAEDQGLPKATVDRTSDALPMNPNQPAVDQSAAPAGAAPAPSVAHFSTDSSSASALLHVPVTHIYPGNVVPQKTLKSPVADDPEAPYRGMKYFVQFNCVGCHAPNGAGGMGPSLSNRKFIYGNRPENIFLTIMQGRAAGMPAFGAMLPDKVIWDLAAYVKSISDAPSTEWGKTTSPHGFTTEQVPAEYKSAADPWAYTEPFSYGQPPFRKVNQKTGEPEQ